MSKIKVELKREFTHELSLIKTELENIKSFAVAMIPDEKGILTNTDESWADVTQKGRIMKGKIHTLEEQVAEVSKKHSTHYSNKTHSHSDLNQPKMEAIAEIEERERRAKNLLAHNLPEIDKGSLGNKPYSEAEAEQVCEVLKTQYQIGLPLSDILHVDRIGRPTGARRPLKLTLKSNIKVIDIVETVRKSTNRQTRPEFSYDKTKLQRESGRTIWSELQRLREEGKDAFVRDGKVIVRGRNPTSKNDNTPNQ